MEKDDKIKKIKEIGRDWTVRISPELKSEKKSAKRRGIPLEYLNLGFYLMTPLLLGTLGGAGLDNWAGTKPVITILGLIFGSVGTFYNLFKLIKEN